MSERREQSSTENNLVELKINKVKTKKRDKIEKFALMKLGYLMAHPFRYANIGATNSGKTTLLVHLLITKHKLFNYFEKIAIFSPTFKNDEVWESFVEAYNPDKKGNKKLSTRYEQFDTIDEAEIERLLSEQRQEISEKGLDEAPKLLIIFDDAMGEKEISGALLKRLFFQSRHYNASIIINSQSYMRIPRDLRLQLSHLTIFMPNQSECQRIADEQQNLYCNCKMLESLIYNACKEKHSFLFINKQGDSDTWYRKKFEEIYKI